uniref:Aminotransferase class I/classII domain-containing protein n=1 Tax=Setaria digitata TaxID=48799 RepID=A0A915PSE0_9BILA
MGESAALDSLPLSQECSEVSESLQKIPFGIHSLALQASNFAPHQLSIATTPENNVFEDLSRRHHPHELSNIVKYSWDDHGCEEKSSSNVLSNEISKQKSFFISLLVYFCWTVLLIFAFLREFLRRHGITKNNAADERPEQRDFVTLLSGFETFYDRNCYMRVRDVFERPISGVPGATVKLLDRYSDDYNWNYKYPGTETEVINTGSYNYMGFAETDGLCGKEATAVIDEQGLSTCCSIQQLGFSKAQRDLEALVAQFLGVDDAVCFSMGFATNSLNTPCLADEVMLLLLCYFYYYNYYY